MGRCLEALEATYEELQKLLDDYVPSSILKQSILEECALLEEEIKLKRDIINKQIKDVEDYNYFKTRVYAWTRFITPKGVNRLLRDINFPLRVKDIQEDFISFIEGDFQKDIPVFIYYNKDNIQESREDLSILFNTYKYNDRYSELVIAGFIRLFKLLDNAA